MQKTTTNKTVIDVIFILEKAYLIYADYSTERVSIDEAWKYIDKISDQLEKTGHSGVKR
jgi:hypothetical protein